MPETLLRTKLFVPPVRPKLVPRPHLIERLNQGLQQGHRLSLISAPAGFGKTTLASEWVGSLRLRDGREDQVADRIAWLSLDEKDNDPNRFLAYFVAALSQAESGEVTIGRGALAMLHSPQPPSAESVLTSLINDVSAVSEGIIFILDDYHLIDAPLVDDALTFMLKHSPPQMHLVIVTRADPDLPLARLRARGQLTELRGADLRFVYSEAAEFLNQKMGLDLSEEDVKALETRTEGWIAGLQLVAISMQGRKDVSSLIQAFTGSHRYVLDYVIDEVLEQQPDDVQMFLLQTAVLDRLTGSLCDALTGHDNGQATLEMLDQANLFIVSLDEKRQWYRYHHLFADLLRQRLRNVRREQAPTLHRRASAWYEKNGFADEAIEHALQAGDFEWALRLIEGQADAVWQRGEHAKLRRWLHELPGELVRSRPLLCIFQAWDLFASGHQEAAELRLKTAEQALNSNANPAKRSSPVGQSQVANDERMKIRGRAATIRAFLASFRGDIQAIHEYSHQALEYLPAEDLTWRSTAGVALGDAYSFVGELATATQVRLEALQAGKAAGNTYMILIASMKLAVSLRQQGQLERVIEICKQQLQLANQSGLSQTGVAGWIMAIWGEALAELNDLDGAIQHAKTAEELTRHGRDLGMIGWTYVCLTRIFYSTGNMAGAQEIVRKMEIIGQDSHVPPWITGLMSAWQVRIWLAQGKLDSASQWLTAFRLDGAEDFNYLHEMETIALARILIARGQLDEAAPLLQKLLEATELGGRTSRMIEILLLQALAFQASGHASQALVKLERALSLAEPGGFVRIFVDQGPAMAHLLNEALDLGIAQEYVQRLLAAYPAAAPEATSSTKSDVDQSELVEVLSDRELEVLGLIAEGLTNREIASRLYLSQHTVKVHTRNIYGKLGVHNRTHAVSRARASGILPSR